MVNAAGSTERSADGRKLFTAPATLTDTLACCIVDCDGGGFVTGDDIYACVNAFKHGCGPHSSRDLSFPDQAVFSIFSETGTGLAPPRPRYFGMTADGAIKLTPHGPTPLDDAQDRFIAAWGQMGGAWGISRTMAEVQALLYITGDPMCTDDIMERLQISRGNASMSVRALLDWGIIVRTHKRGDRKEYFRAEADVWAMFRAIVRERTKREVDPLLASLYEIRDLTGTAIEGRKQGRARASASRVSVGRASVERPSKETLDHNARLDAMVDFFETVEQLGQRFVSPAGRGLQLAASLLASPLLGGKKKGKRDQQSPDHLRGNDHEVKS